ncbi:MAG TPA: ABC transporter ATP-binding protein [Thermoanaerobaculia bacterium]|nr:ABC transporter ATP-binding protein [Thermoanaerobaculia bacterium]
MKVLVEDVAFAYGRQPVLAAVSLDVPEGGLTAVVGAAGCGKSTLLRLLAGLLRPGTGRILFDGEDVTRVPAERRDVGVVFQTCALFPHLTVRENIAFGLRAGRRRYSLRSSRRRPSRHTIEARVWDAAAFFGVERLLDSRICQLSTEEKQRVAWARAAAPRPGLLLLDEPLAVFDSRLRRTLQCELAALLRQLNTTVVYATRDQEEAMLVADHLAVLEECRVAQTGPPLEIYRHPCTPYVASLLGEANLIEIAAEGVDGSPVRTPLGRFPLPPQARWLMVRPEEVTEDPSGAAATVLDCRAMGSYDRVVLLLEGDVELVAHFPTGTSPVPGSRVRIGLRCRRPHFLLDAGC